MSKVTPNAERPAIKEAFVTRAPNAPVSAAIPAPALTLSPTSDFRCRSDVRDGYFFGSDIDFAEGKLREVTEIGALERDWMSDAGYCPSIRSELRAKAAIESPQLTQQISWITPVMHQPPLCLTWDEVMSGYSVDGSPGCVPDDSTLRNAYSSVTLQSRHRASIADHADAKNDDEAESCEYGFVGNGGGAVLVTPSGEEVSYSTTLLARGDAISEATTGSDDGDLVAFTFPDEVPSDRAAGDVFTVGRGSGAGVAVALSAVEKGDADTSSTAATYTFRIQGAPDIVDSAGEFDNGVIPAITERTETYIAAPYTFRVQGSLEFLDSSGEFEDGAASVRTEAADTDTSATFTHIMERDPAILDSSGGFEDDTASVTAIGGGDTLFDF